MTDILKNSELQQSCITAVMPRFFVDERNGCIAIRDRQHPDFDIDHQYNKINVVANILIHPDIDYNFSMDRNSN